jgi:hypothetical protein
MPGATLSDYERWFPMHTSLRCFTGHNLAVPPHWARVDISGMGQREKHSVLLCPPAFTRWSSFSGPAVDDYAVLAAMRKNYGVSVDMY